MQDSSICEETNPSSQSNLALDARRSFLNRDQSRLPAYKASTKWRYHPYVRYIAPPPHYNEEAHFNTIYDDERVILDVPARVPTTEEEQVHHNQLERWINHIQRVQRLRAVMVEFFDGLRRAVDP